ncbi:MAG: fumarate hydratase [Lachnospiraceae bacterium]|nr:fumarate hydratase [Lachnospiraceae bacterium]
MNDIRIVDAKKITETVRDLCIKANLCLNDDVRQALFNASLSEENQTAKKVLNLLLENAKLAEVNQLPLCQDTGMVIVFVTIGENVHVTGNISAAINEGIRVGYRKGYFRNSVIDSPLSRNNTNDNTPAVIHYDFAPGDEIKITVMPKGFGSENMGNMKMLNPADGIAGAEEFIIETVKKAGANPCPPLIVGVGLGGTMEKAALLSKQALIRAVGSPNPDPVLNELEERFLRRINQLDIGPAGYGGLTTALAVQIVSYPTHIAGFPVAVNTACHALRHRTEII